MTRLRFWVLGDWLADTMQDNLKYLNYSIRVIRILKVILAFGSREAKG